jgi:6-methylsalicylate decarboxylase
MRIDVHAHYWTDDYLDLLVDLGKTDTGTQRGLGAGGGEELDARLRLMDRAGVDMQVLSASPQLPHGEDRGKAVAAARFVNNQYAALVERHPDRFLAFAATPMPHIDASIAELGRALDELHMVGVTMNTTVLGQALAEPRYEPIFAELDRRGAVLYLHPAGNGACTPLISEYHLTWMVGAPMEDTISVMQLISHGIPSRYPRIKSSTRTLAVPCPCCFSGRTTNTRGRPPALPSCPAPRLAGCGTTL